LFLSLVFPLVVILVLTTTIHAIPVRQAVELVGGIGEFINGVQSSFGRAGEFANQNGFDYGNVYNSLLQYSVMNAYMERENNQLLQTQLAETSMLREDSAAYAFRETLITSILQSLIFLVGVGILVVQLVSSCSQRRRPEPNY
jgi:hypothetical protein